MSEAPKEEAKVQESKVFNLSEVEGEEDLRDAWGRSTEADEGVNFEESPYMGMKVDELKAELKVREDAGRQFDKGSIKTKRDLVAALEADDKAQAREAAEADQE
jgi:hypothetical protein